MFTDVHFRYDIYEQDQPEVVRMPRILRNRKLLVMAATVIIYIVGHFLATDYCEILPGSSKTTARYTFGNQILRLFGYKDLTNADVEDFVQSEPLLKEFVFSVNSEICKSDSSVFLLAVVPSKPLHIHERQAIRETWGSRFKTDDKLRLVFLLGMTDDITNKLVLEEQKMYSDLVQASFVDSYRNLTLKTTSMLQWKIQYCPQAQFLLKIDEDAFLRTNNLVSTLIRFQNEKRFILGNIESLGIPYRNHIKWQVNHHEYPFDRYPAYTYGSAYVISGDLVRNLYSIARHKPRLPVEDVYLTGLCAHIAQARLVGQCGFYIVPSYLLWFTSETATAAWDYTPEELRALWVQLEKWKNWLPYFIIMWKIVYGMYSISVIFCIVFICMMLIRKKKW